MHILTKVFVMLATVLAVALSAMVIAYAVNTDRVQQDYNAALAEKAAVTSVMATTSTQGATSLARAEAAAQSAVNARDEALARVRTLDAEKATLLTAKNKAESGLQSIQSKIAELSETAKTQANLITNYRQENSSLRTSELTYRNRQLDMEQRLADLLSQVEVFSQQNRALQEQIVELQKQASLASVAGAGGSSSVVSTQPYVYNGPKIQGVVQELQNDTASGRQLALVTIGTNDRVAKNMKFTVLRGNDFICNLVILQPDMKTSIGYIDLVGKAGEVRAGDTVVSKVE